MEISRKNKKAFTLIEVLIALTIFSFAMVICSGIFSMIIGNQSLISVNSEVNRETQRIMRQISDDTVNATKIGKTTSDNPEYSYDNIEGIAFLTANNKIVLPGDGCVNDSPVTNCNFRGIVLFGNDGASDNTKIYRFVPTEGGIGDIWYCTKSGLTLTLTSDGRVDSTSCPGFKRLNNNKVEIDLRNPINYPSNPNYPMGSGFLGHACYSSAASCNVAPFVKIFLTVQTKGYNTLSADRRAKLLLRTLVSSRNY